ncbi:hypothetical protein ACGFJ7_23770 [Actinoplanes sp. NPDC048988]|uniref:hypothetical protein n=1 Tax=Actinoplanes sp. NPDC048988 TaxID=3363901 RepID=UPI0037114B19
MVRGLTAATETRYATGTDVCGALETGPLAAGLGVTSPRPEKGPLPSICRYAVFDAGRRQGAGQLRIDRFASSFEASLAWQGQESDCDDLEALQTALIDSTRATMAHFG